MSQAKQGTTYFYIKSKLSSVSNVLFLDLVGKKTSAGTKICIENFHPGLSLKWFWDGKYLRNAAAPQLVLDISGVKGPDVILYVFFC